MDTQLIPMHQFDLVSADADKDTRYRLGKFVTWMRDQGRDWHQPDLAAYRDHLLASGKAASTVSAHLSTIRAQYRRLLKDNATRELLFAIAAQQATGPADQKALVDELTTRIENAINPERSQVKTVTRQDRPDADHLRLTEAQANALLAAPGVSTLRGLRDTSVIALLLCTGIREAELCALDAGDLRQRLGGELALHVREGKGRKERLIPYGELSWVLAIIDRWLSTAGIENGPVFRGLYKGNKRLRPSRLSVRAVGYIVADYPIAVDGQLVTVTPHDLRRTYARRLYEAGVDLVAIQQNLGHSSLQTTLGYVGTLDADKRRAPAIYSFDLGQLNGQQKS